MKVSHDPLNAALEIREQLASETRRLLFFFGAGTSMSIGLPGIVKLTADVAAKLKASQKDHFTALMQELPANPNIETVLDRIRTYRELIGDNKNKSYDGLNGDDAKNLDLAICKNISEIVRSPTPHGLGPYSVFTQWIRALHSRRDRPVEIFTTNYDLCIERAMEDLGVPFFDGFIGSVSAFFAPEAVEAEGTKQDDFVYPPRAWTRLWKLHGSINWCLKPSTVIKSNWIVRTASVECKAGDELAIFPSRDKYLQSRKLPFLALQDRLRQCLFDGECLLVIVGYSFSDQHLNQIIFQGLRSNPRLAITSLLFSDNDDILNYGVEYRNLSVYTPSQACVGGIKAPWGEPRQRKESEEWPFWDDASKKFMLGDFHKLSKFLEVFVGFNSSIKPTSPYS